MQVESLMNRKTVTCRAEDALTVPAQAMWNQDLGCILVLDDARRPVGVITDRDICMAALHTGERLSEILVATCMSEEVHTCKPTDTVKAAQELMSREQIRRLPVVDQVGKLVGVLSVSDIARASATAMRKPDGVESKEVAQTMAAITQPRSSSPRTYA